MSEEVNRPDVETGEAERQLRPTSVDTAAVKAAREGLARTAKDAGGVLKELAFKALELEQVSLFTEAEFEPAFFEQEEVIRKKYTADQANKIEMRRRTCVYLLARNCPVEDIMRLLEMNFRTVQAIAQQNGRALAGFTEAYAQELLAGAASDIALADTRKGEATYKDLHYGADVKSKIALAMKVGGVAGADPNADAIEVEAENPALQSARAFLKGTRKPVEIQQEGTEKTEETK